MYIYNNDFMIMMLEFVLFFQIFHFSCSVLYIVCLIIISWFFVTLNDLVHIYMFLVLSEGTCQRSVVSITSQGFIPNFDCLYWNIMLRNCFIFFTFQR